MYYWQCINSSLSLALKDWQCFIGGGGLSVYHWRLLLQTGAEEIIVTFFVSCLSHSVYLTDPVGNSSRSGTGPIFIPIIVKSLLSVLFSGLK